MIADYQYINVNGGFSEGLAPVNTGNWGFVDSSGSMVIKAVFDYAYPFSGGYALVQDEIEDGYFFIDHSGASLQDLRFKKAKSFSGQLAAVQIDNKWGYISTTGALVIEAEYDEDPD